MRSQLMVPAVLLVASFAVSYAVVMRSRSGAEPVLLVDPAAAVPAAVSAAPAEGVVIPRVEPERGEQMRAAEAIAEGTRVINSGPDAEQRGEALTRFAGMVVRPGAPPDTALLHALFNAATSDQEWQIRMRAVISLAQAAQQMSDKSEVMVILERAAQDPHKSVAARARAALTSLAAPQPGFE